ncbi:Hypothetical predicted protein [Pelobates cultripes]|uniref:Uncharacterized protein n=1 Tax=Pelobates cultripes TaxID=61616 RepID=A0AAD1SHM3_PELCU|nr:Hypothetical predicted protein [Pelobates cultripes]CAH2300458.1 Hypothetical predicted protein [Pelobates cultripes]
MGRNRRGDPTGTPRSSQAGQSYGPMDGFLQTPADTRDEAGDPKMAAHSAATGDTPASTLEGIGDELRTIAASMATKADLLVLTTTIQDALRAEMAGIRTEVTAQGTRIQELEHSHEAHTARLVATDTTVARQGVLLLQLRRAVEDLDNRGRRCNIRVRGLPEAEGEEDVEDTLTALFRMILPADTSLALRYERAHRALRPRSLEDGPRDIICCIHSFATKDAIMKAGHWGPARGRNAHPADVGEDHRRDLHNDAVRRRKAEIDDRHPDAAHPPAS